MKNYSCPVNHQWEADFLNKWAKARNWGEQTVWKVGKGFDIFFAGVDPFDGKYYHGVVGNPSTLRRESETISLEEMVAFLEKERPKKEHTLELNPQLSVVVGEDKITLRFGADGEFCHKMADNIFERIVNFWQENKS